MQDKNGFEIETCSRCGGTGKHSYCERYRDVCFKCCGKRVHYTKRGSAANAFFREMFETEAGSIKVGDTIINRWLCGTKKEIVLSLKSSNVVGSSNGLPYNYPGVMIETKTGVIHCRLSDKVTKCDPDEIFREKLKAAIDFQDTLTKQGKPRKSRKTC